MQFTSEKKSFLEHAFVVSFAVGALILWAISGAEGVPQAWPFQLGAVVFAGFFVYLAVRYELKQYRYEIKDSGIRDDEGEVRLELVVTECVGKKETVVARVGLWQIEAVSVRDKTNKKVDFCQGKTAFVYDNRLFSPRRFAIRMSGSDPVVVIPYNQEMANFITNKAGKTS